MNNRKTISLMDSTANAFEKYQNIFLHDPAAVSGFITDILKDDQLEYDIVLFIF